MDIWTYWCAVVCVAGHESVLYHVSNQGIDGDGWDSSLLSLVNYDHFNTFNGDYTLYFTSKQAKGSIPKISVHYLILKKYCEAQGKGRA